MIYIQHDERMKNVLEAARHNLDYEIEIKVLHEHFYDNALYHSACMTNYLLKTLKEKVNLETAFLRFVSEINSGLMVECKAFLMSTLQMRQLVNSYKHYLYFLVLKLFRENNE
jgi:hypothetical protein